LSVFTKRSLIAVLAASAALAGCVSPTTYRPATGYGQNATGFTDQRIEADRFIVTFAGNSVTSRERVEKYLLFRAAELSLQNGFDHFSIVERDTERKTDTYVDRGFRGGAGYGFGGGYGLGGGGLGFGRGGYYGAGLGYWGPSWRFARRGYGFGGWAGYGRDPFFDDYQVRQIDRYEASAEIVAGRGPRAAGDTSSFDARQVVANLGPTIELPRDRRS
jgi:hypothetical protein